jgi:uncharacterized heparinase superfamily protein
VTAEPDDPLRANRETGVRARWRRLSLRWQLAAARSWPKRRGQRASRFVLVPPHLHLADPSVAADFMTGQIVLAGRSLLAGGRSPFDMPPPGRAFAQALHGFGWLCHFEASAEPSLRAGARGLVAQWLDRRAAGGLPEADAPEAITRRIIAWVTHSTLITEKVEFAAYRRIIDHLVRDAALAHVLARRRDIGMRRLEAAVALLVYALSLDRPDSAVRQAELLVEAAIRACILPDGGPKSRNAGALVEIVATLIPLLALYRARPLPVPEFLNPAIARMVGFIRMMQHPDGGLALFAGAGLVMRDLVAEVTRFGAGRVARLDCAPQTGFERLENEHGVLIADAGARPEGGFAGEAGASALAFEFSTKSDRLIVNCGIPPSAEGEVARSFRAAPAHSGVLIDDIAPGTILPVRDAFGRPELRLFAHDDAATPQREATSLIIGHRGLRARIGYAVERHLTLMPDRGGLFGFDRFLDVEGKGGNRRVTLAFHLHPRVLPVRLSRQDAIVLRLPHQPPGRDVWLFEAPGIALRLEESRCFEQDSMLPKTEAIILDLPISGTSEIHWRLTPYRG